MIGRGLEIVGGGEQLWSSVGGLLFDRKGEWSSRAGRVDAGADRGKAFGGNWLGVGGVNAAAPFCPTWGTERGRPGA